MQIYTARLMLVMQGADASCFLCKFRSLNKKSDKPKRSEPSAQCLIASHVQALFIFKCLKFQPGTEGIPEALAAALLVFFHSLFQPDSASRSLQGAEKHSDINARYRITYRAGKRFCLLAAACVFLKLHASQC